MATLRKEKGHYYGVFYDPNRQPIRKCVTLRTTVKSAARAKLTDYEGRFARGEWDPWRSGPPSSALSLSDLLQRYLSSKPRLRERSIEAYTTATNGLAEILPAGATLEMVSSNDISGYVYDPAVSASTQHHRYRHLHALFSWAVKRSFLGYSPMENVEVPKQRKSLPQFLSVGELDRVVDTIRQGPASHRWLADVVVVAAYTGLRRGELCALRWIDVDLESRRIQIRNTDDFVSKSGHERSIPLATRPLEILRRLAESNASGSEHVFLQRDGVPLSGDRVGRLFKRYSKSAGLPEFIHFHSLRHTCASWMAQRGRSLQEVQLMLGHSSIQMAQRYAHLAPDSLRLAVDEALG